MFFRNMNSASDYGLNCVMCCTLTFSCGWVFPAPLKAGPFSLLGWLSQMDL